MSLQNTDAQENKKESNLESADLVCNEGRYPFDCFQKGGRLKKQKTINRNNILTNTIVVSILYQVVEKVVFHRLVKNIQMQGPRNQEE
jgi:hypothetical protein